MPDDPMDDWHRMLARARTSIDAVLALRVFELRNGRVPVRVCTPGPHARAAGDRRYASEAGNKRWGYIYTPIEEGGGPPTDTGPP